MLPETTCNLVHFVIKRAMHLYGYISASDMHYCVLRETSFYVIDIKNIFCHHTVLFTVKMTRIHFSPYLK